MRRSRRIVERHVLKPGEVEVTSEFPVDAGQQVTIEHRRHAERVVVGGNELGQGFFQIRPEQHCIPRVERLANLTQEVLARPPIEVANRAAQEKHHDSLAGPAASHRPAQAIQVLGLKSHNADVRQIIEFALTVLQRRRGDLNGTVRCRPVVRESFQDPAGLPATAAAEFNHHAMRSAGAPQWPPSGAAEFAPPLSSAHIQEVW